MNKSEIIIVDEKDEIIGYKERGALDRKDICRVSALWIVNSQGEILLAKRHRNKSKYPERWGPAVSGTVERRETYHENIIKEAEEEIGIKNSNFEVGPKTKMENSDHFTQWYLLKIDREVEDFVLEKNEVEKVQWFSPEELRDQFQKHPENFIPNIKKYFELFCD